MRSLEIRTQRIFNNLIQQNQKLGSDSVLQQSSTMSSVQGPASRVQRTTLASRVQEFRFADQRKVKLFSSIIFLPLLCFKKNKRWTSESVTASIAINFIQYPLMISKNTNFSRIITKFLIFLSLL